MFVDDVIDILEEKSNINKNRILFQIHHHQWIVS